MHGRSSDADLSRHAGACAVSRFGGVSGPGWAKQSRDDPLRRGNKNAGDGALRGRRDGGRIIYRDKNTQRGTDAIAFLVHILRAVAFLIFAAIVLRLLGRRMSSCLTVGVVIVCVLLAADVRCCLRGQPHCHGCCIHAPGRQPARHQRNGEQASYQHSDERMHCWTLAPISGRDKRNGANCFAGLPCSTRSVRSPVQLIVPARLDKRCPGFPAEKVIARLRSGRRIPGGARSSRPRRGNWARHEGRWNAPSPVHDG